MTTAASARPRSIADVFPEVCTAPVGGVTQASTGCCGIALQHAVIALRGNAVFLWFDAHGNQVAVCPCGHELPDPRRWRP